MPEDKDDKDELAKKQLELMTGIATSLKSLTDRVDGMETSNKSITETIANINKQTAPAKPVEEKDEDLTSLDLESLDRAGFANVLVNHIVGALEKQIVRPMNERVDTIEGSADVQKIQREFQAVADANKDDFDRYKPSMIEMLKENPHLNAKQLFTLVKSETPNAGLTEEEITEKDEKESKSKGDESRSAETLDDLQKSFGGLLPNSGQQSGDTSSATVEDAAEKAWDDTMQVGGAENG